MRHKLIKLLIWLKVIHGGHLEVREYEKHDFWYFMICHKCDYEWWLSYDDEVDPALWAILCGEPFTFTYPPKCGDHKWWWDGTTRIYELDD